MILYETKSTPYYEPAYERFALDVKMGDDGEVFEDAMMFETEDDAWLIYHESKKRFEFMTDRDITEVILESRTK